MKLLIANIYLVVAIIYTIRNIKKMEKWNPTINVVVGAFTLCVFVYAMILNFVYPYKQIGEVVSMPEAPLVQVEHNGIKYQGVDVLYPVEDFTIPPVRPAQYKPVYKNFYGVTLN